MQIYVIHSSALAQRLVYLNPALSLMREGAKSAGLELKFATISHPDDNHIESNVEAYNKRIEKSPVGDKDFDVALGMQSIQTISNLEKHREAWNRIAAAGEPAIVVEDDLLVLQENKQHIGALFKEITTTDADFMLLTLTTDGANGSQDIREISKILPTKCAYMIRPTLAKKLYNTTERMRFPARYEIALYLHRNREIRAVVPKTERIFIEGSKLGVVPSSIHSNNVLVFNKEFMQMWEILNKSETLSREDVQAAKGLSKIIAHLKSPDVMHILGIIIFKGGNKQEAADVLLEAFKEMKRQGGLLGPRSDLHNNTINIYESLQEDLAELSKLPSKYAST